MWGNLSERYHKKDFKAVNNIKSNFNQLDGISELFEYELVLNK